MPYFCHSKGGFGGAKMRKIDLVYETIRENPYIIAKNIAKETGITYNYTRVLLHRLVHDCKIVGEPSIFYSRSYEYRVRDN